MIVERFAPSPTGLLHLGHAYSAWCAWQAARSARGHFLLRLEDLDTSRVRPEYAGAIERDLTWLGLGWDGDVLCQSTRTAAHHAALAQLADQGLVYRCRCTRRDIRDAASAPQEGAAIAGPDGLIYPGTCRQAGHGTDTPAAIRLDMTAAIRFLGGASALPQLGFTELMGGGEGPGVHRLDADKLTGGIGDAVLARKDGAIAYHLAVVVDDAFQGVSHVTRGEDLFSATPLHRLLQALLALPTPVYRHHPLVRDGAGRRLAKRDDARAIAFYRERGLAPAEVIEMARLNVRSA